MLKPSDRKKAMEHWKIEGPIRKAAREARGIFHVEEEDVAEYTKRCKELSTIYSIGPAPLMPLLGQAAPPDPDSYFDAVDTTVEVGGDSYEPWVCMMANAQAQLEHQASHYSEKEHIDFVAQAGMQSNDYFAMVHKPIPIDKAWKIPDAKGAIDAEIAKHERLGTWDLKGVQPKASVQARARRESAPATHN